MKIKKNSLFTWWNDLYRISLHIYRWMNENKNEQFGVLSWHSSRDWAPKTKKFWKCCSSPFLVWKPRGCVAVWTGTEETEAFGKTMTRSLPDRLLSVTTRPPAVKVKPRIPSYCPLQFHLMVPARTFHHCCLWSLVFSVTRRGRGPSASCWREWSHESADGDHIWVGAETLIFTGSVLKL